MVADSVRKIPPQSDFFIENGVKDFSYIIEDKKNYIVGNTNEASITRRRERSELGVLYNWL